MTEPRPSLAFLGAAVCAMAACVPPGATHGPRVQQGTHLGVTVGNFPTDREDTDAVAALELRFASESRRAGRRGHQISLIAPLPYLVETFREPDVWSPLVLIADYYRETDHPNSERVPRGWGVQASLSHVAPYAKIGWYGERVGVHVTNGLGVYADAQDYLPPSTFAWWPSVALEVQPVDWLTGSVYLGGMVHVQLDDMDPDYEVHAGVSLSGRMLD